MAGFLERLAHPKSDEWSRSLSERNSAFRKFPYLQPEACGLVGLGFSQLELSPSNL